MKFLKGKTYLRFFLLLSLAIAIPIQEEEYAKSHVAIDLSEIPKKIIDLLNQAILMKTYAKTPADEVLCRHVLTNVSLESLLKIHLVNIL